MSTGRFAVRRPAVAGTFYPEDPSELGATMSRCFVEAVRPEPGAPAPKAIVVPHAGYIYSGSVAASAYLRIEPARSVIRRVVLLGPSHHVHLRGMALSSADAWRTPLGYVHLATDAIATLGRLPRVAVDDLPHAPEHSLEVQLPFLQTVLDEFELVPLVVGAASTDEVVTALDAVWGGPETVVVVSTDLSHYHQYADARQLDSRTAAAITAMRPREIDDMDACGARPLRGLLKTASDRHLSVEQLDLRNSGDTAGDHRRVVGYGSFAVS